MPDSYDRDASLIKNHIKKSESEQAKEIVEERLRNKPEEPLNYLLMAYYYYLLAQGEDTLYWIKETLKRAPEHEYILETVLVFFDIIDNREIFPEIVETGLRLYPNNALFHMYYAEMHRRNNQEQSKASFEEAIRLDPDNYIYLAAYAMLLYQMYDDVKAEKYEQLSLQYNPENSQTLLQFAWFAYQMKKFKKAQFLIDEALRIDPNNALIREYYERIYPSRNRFVLATQRMNRVLAKIFVYPAHFLWKLSKDKIPFGLILSVVFILEIIGLYFLYGTDLYTILGMYLIILYISSKIKRSMLQKIGFTNVEEVAMEVQTKATQTDALKEMKQVVSRNTVQLNSDSQTLSSDELEAQLTKMWNADNITTLRDKSQDKMMQNKEDHSSNTSSTKEKQTPIVYPKESINWSIYAMIAALVLVFAIRFVPYLTEQANRPEPVDPVLKESIEQVQIQQKMEKEETLYEEVEETSEIVEQFLQAIDSDDLVEAISPYVSTDFESIILGKSNDPLLRPLANAQIEKVIQPHQGLSIHYFLVVNETENTHAIIEVVSKQITNLLAEQWSESQEEIEKYETLMNRMETKVE